MFLPVKRELFLSTVTSCMLRTGDWTVENFRLVSLAFKIVFELALYLWIGLILNLTNWIWLDYDYNEMDCNWLDSISKVPLDDICCDLELYKSTELNWIESLCLKQKSLCILDEREMDRWKGSIFVSGPTSNPHLWSSDMDSEQKNDIAHASSSKVYPSEGGWAQP